MNHYIPKDSPISLIEWRDPAKTEYRETWDALASFADDVALTHCEVHTAAEAKEAVRLWFQQSPKNAQYSYIGAHGLITPAGECVGIGTSSTPGEHAKWSEIWSWYAQGELLGGLWLGGCKTRDAAEAFTPFLEKSRRGVIPYLYGWSNPNVDPEKELKPLLLKLIELTKMDDVIWLDDELEHLRRSVPQNTIELFYPAFTKAGHRAYVNVESMEREVGLTFRELLENQALRNCRHQESAAKS